MWNIKESAQCTFCPCVDNLEHFFFYCSISHAFWLQLINWLNRSLKVNRDISVLEALFGIINVDKDQFYWLNFIILIAKYFISKCKQNVRELSLESFMKVLKSKISMEKIIYHKRDREHLFNERFLYLYNVLY